MKPLVSDWELRLNTIPRRIIAVLVVLFLFSALIYRSWFMFHAAWITRTGAMDLAIYEQATLEDPNNADYHFRLGQIYNSQTQYLDVDRARYEFLAATRLNPDNAAQWLELSRFYEQEMELDQARTAMQMALDKDPNYAKTHWVAANLYLRLGDHSAADRELRRTADLDANYVTQVLDLVWRFYGDAARVMSTHVPDTKDANLAALNYFVMQKSEAGTTLAWNRLKKSETTATERMPYLNYMMDLKRPHVAAAIFSYPAEPPAFFNPGFETEPMNDGFDWVVYTSENAEARRDTTVAKDGMASELVIFGGKENVDYAAISHRLSVEKGKRYNLTFWMKTEAITTNEGMYVEVDGESSMKQNGTSYWQEFTIPFTASSDMVTVRLRRTASKKLDNMLKGKVWIDAFELSTAR